jgi:hypothetical protein
MNYKRKADRWSVRRFIPLITTFVFFLLCFPLLAQTDNENGQTPKELAREKLDINTIATLSVGIVIQTYGYIGTYGDLLGKGVYDATLVVQMLRDTIQYLNNAQNVIHQYQSRTIDVASGDRRFLGEIEEIIKILIQEAENLTTFAQTHKVEDLEKFNDSRKHALRLIDKLTKI